MIFEKKYRKSTPLLINIVFISIGVVYFQYSLHDVSSRTKVDGIDY